MAGELEVEKAIVLGLYKALRGSAFEFASIADVKIRDTFTSVGSPGDWETFFVEATGTAIQHELIAIRCYRPGLTEKLVEQSGKNKRMTWEEFRDFVIAQMEALN